VDGEISSIEACERLNWQSDTLTREVTQSSGVSCGESSSESVASPTSLKSQTCPFPVSPAEPHMTLKGHPICAAGNRVQRSSTKTRMEENERIVATAPLSKYEDEEVVNTFLKCICSAIVPFLQSSLQQLLHMIHNGFVRDR
jgi:hypothetical protein